MHRDVFLLKPILTGVKASYSLSKKTLATLHLKNYNLSRLLRRWRGENDLQRHTNQQCYVTSQAGTEASFYVEI